MIKLSKKTTAILASCGRDEDMAIAKYHLGLNRFLHTTFGYVTNHALLNMKIARIEARMNSEGLKPIKKSTVDVSIFV